MAVNWIEDDIATRGISNVQLAVCQHRRLSAAARAVGTVVPEKGPAYRVEVVALSTGVRHIHAGAGNGWRTVIAVHHRAGPEHGAIGLTHRVYRASGVRAAGGSDPLLGCGRHSD